MESVKTKIKTKLREEKLTTDSNLQYKGLMALRKEYGFNIQDDDLKTYYENTMTNLLKNND